MSTETESLPIEAPDGWMQPDRNTIELRNENSLASIYRYPDGSCAGRYCAAVYRNIFNLARLFDDLDTAIAWSTNYLNTDLASYKSAIAEKVMEELRPRIDQLVSLGHPNKIQGYEEGYKNGRIAALKSIKANLENLVDWNLEEIAQ